MGYLRERSRVEPPGTARGVGQRREGAVVGVVGGSGSLGPGKGRAVRWTGGRLGERPAGLRGEVNDTCACLSLCLSHPRLYASIWSPVSVCAPV